MPGSVGQLELCAAAAAAARISHGATQTASDAAFAVTLGI